jgi:lipoyl(octanoyl) transferase
MPKKACLAVDLGVMPYGRAFELQRALAEARKAGAAPDTLLLCEHPHVITLGRSGHRENLRASGRLLSQLGVEFHPTNRGGDITYHGPGQLVGYPVIGLAEPLDVVKYVRRLEESLMKVCADLGLDTVRIDGRSGVWVSVGGDRPARKVAAIGVRVSRATTMHGFALNCDCDLGAFAAIVPCGISDAGVTSLSAELRRTVAVDEVRAAVAAAVCDALDGALPVRQDPVARVASSM